MKGETKMTTAKRCSVCGKKVKEGEYDVDLGEIICNECQEEYVRCDECMEYKKKSEMKKVVEDSLEYYICENCVEEATEACEHCGEVHIKEYTQEVIKNDGTTVKWCQKCRGLHATRCQDCGVLMEVVATGRRAICQGCRANYGICEMCGTFTRIERLIECEDDEGQTQHICQNCDNNYSSERFIRDYGYKPEPIFRHVNEDTLSEKRGEFYGGVELEIGTGGEIHRKAKMVMKVLGENKAYAKHDGSVDSGFEIVTHPCTLEFHRKEFGWKELCAKAVNLGYRGHDNQSCGMHVHVNRKFLGKNSAEIDETVSKMILFVENNWSSVVKFSRREASRINQWAGNYSTRRPIEECKNKKEKCEKLINNAKSQGDRRRAINITNNHTIEFRLFRSTLKSNTIIANIEFCYLLAYCCKKWTYSTVERTKFVNLKRQAEKLGLNEFITYCEERGM